jgi:NAD(P)-dependent dehydrogenase (short-subunit alcohol dehydrogenase family)
MTPAGRSIFINGQRDPAPIGGSTDVLHLGRSGEPEEIASVVDFLVGDAASIIARAMIDVNGGL